MNAGIFALIVGFTIGCLTGFLIRKLKLPVTLFRTNNMFPAGLFSIYSYVDSRSEKYCGMTFCEGAVWWTPDVAITIKPKWRLVCSVPGYHCRFYWMYPFWFWMRKYGIENNERRVIITGRYPQWVKSRYC